jgi:hypothetical protein
MFGLPSPSGKKVSRVRPSARLALERLESRDNPSTLTMTLEYSGSLVTASGHLANASTLANQAIAVTGEAGGTTYTDANGNYSVTLSELGSGQVNAQTLDGSSNIASGTIVTFSGGSSSSGALLTMSVSYGAGTSITLSGSLSDTSQYAGQTIVISGKASGTTVTDANGNFSVTLNASGLGLVFAVTQDGSSNIASVTLTDTPPSITEFNAVEGGGNVWEFTGTVTWNQTWEYMGGEIQGPPKIGTVGFTAVSEGEMSGGTCTGTFAIAILLDGTQATNGNYIATVTDCWGQVSNEAIENVYQTGT